MKRYHTLSLLAPIGDQAPSIPEGHIADALGADATVGGESFIDLRDRFTDGSSEALAGALGEIAATVRALPGDDPLAIFAFGPIPLVMALGRVLGDKRPARVFDSHRHTNSWRWEHPATTEVEFEYVAERRPRADQRDVAVLLSISGPVNESLVARWLPTGYPTYEIRIVSEPDQQPNRVRSEAQLDAFRSKWRELLNDVKKNHGADARIHLFPAVPLSVAVECGRRLLPKADPEVRVYDLKKGAYHYALTLDGPAAHEGVLVDPEAGVPVRADLVVLVALVEEFRELKALVPSLRPLPNAGSDGGTDFFSEIETDSGARRTVVFTLAGQMGIGHAQTAAERAIVRWSPRMAVNIGIAGALDAGLPLGDVVVADQVDAYDATLKAGRSANGQPGLEHRGEVFRADTEVCRRARAFEFTNDEAHARWADAGRGDACEMLAPSDAVWRAPQLHVGHLASGSWVIDSPEWSAWLKGRDGKILAVEMEAAALGRATAGRNSIPWAVFRGLVDRADGEKGKVERETKGALRRLSMRNATRLFLEFVRAGIL